MKYVEFGFIVSISYYIYLFLCISKYFYVSLNTYKIIKILLDFSRNYFSHGTDPVGFMVILAFTPVPFPEFFLFLKLPAIGKAENGADWQIFQENSFLNRVMGMKRPGKFGIALAVRPGVVDLFPYFGANFQWKNIFIYQQTQHECKLFFPCNSMGFVPSAVFFPGQQVGDFMGKRQEEFKRVQVAVDGHKVDIIFYGRSVVT